MSTAIVIILFVIAMMLGPLMFMRPSASQKRIAQLRTAAQKQGLRIRMDHNPFAEKAPSLAVYSLVFTKRKSAEHWPTFSLFRKNYAHDIHFCGEWDWYKQGELSQQQVQALRRFLSALDKSIVGVECNQSSVGIFWRERMQALSDEEALQRVLRDLQNLEALCETPV